ncbi:MAG: RnfABCDGE type electron transport complex subunit D [Candidatus Omnitrophica bacterium]|nr:RnfABCDGE type electron transport complex subunit D [Candidatus Omnitrophota bacterium]
MFKLRSIKTQLILYLAALAVFISIKDKDAAFLFTATIAVISSVSLEALIVYFKTKTLRITESSCITGLIIGFVLSGNQAFWKLVAAAAIAILSKSVFRFHKKHIFNPAGFGIFLTLIFLGADTYWKGTYLWYIIVPFGLYFSYKLRRLEILYGYFLVFLALFGTQAIFQKVSPSNIFGYLSYFYIFVMVIEPITTPIKPAGRFLFGAGVSLLIFILTQAGARFDVELFSLLALNMAVPLLNKVPDKVFVKKSRL